MAGLGPGGFIPLLRRKPEGPRDIRCYRCAHPFQVAQEALSTSCPKCHRNITVEDVILKKNRPKLVMVTEVQTCGRLVIPKGARLVADKVEAHAGVEVDGHLEAREVSGEAVTIGKKAYWKGTLKAGTLVVEASAVIERAFFDVRGHRAPEPARESEATSEPG